MECDIIGSPQPVITWYCDRKALPEGDKFSTSYDGRVARLIMKSAAKGDNGRYECVAQSSAGQITCDCLLVVKGLYTSGNKSDWLRSSRISIFSILNTEINVSCLPLQNDNCLYTKETIIFLILMHLANVTQHLIG